MILVKHISSESMVDDASRIAKDSERPRSESPQDVITGPFPPSTLEPNETECSPKPFFIMDWLERIDEKDLELARQMLKTPGGRSSTPKLSTTMSLESISKQLFSPNPSSSASCPSLSPVSPCSASSQESATLKFSSSSPFALRSSCAAEHTGSATKKILVSPFRKRSIEIGKGWNAKGLQKAKVGAWEKALRCWENALEVRTQVLGETHVDVANTCNNMGIALGKLDRHEDAVTSLERALEIRTRHYGREHKEVAATLHNLGNVYHQAGDLASALECFEEAKCLQENVFGPNHIQVARACVAIGHTCNQARRHSCAIKAYKNALFIFKLVGLSETDMEVQTTRADLVETEQLIRRE